MSGPSSTNILVLAALGVGAYVLLAKPRTATAAGAAPRAQTGPLSNLLGLAESGFNLLRGIGSGAVSGTVDGRAATQWDVTPFGSGGPAYNNPSAYTAPDSIIANPVNTDVFDWGSGAAYGNQDLGSFF